MLALYRSGRQAEALAAYREARETLVETLGIEPGAALRQLERAILDQDPSLDVAAVGAGRAAAPRRSPQACGAIDLVRRPRATSCGRSPRCSASVDVRLLTLTGAGGSGKTRLASRRRTASATSSRTASCWSNSPRSATRDLVAAAIADTLGIGSRTAGRSRWRCWSAYLRDREMLLVLDNFEQRARGSAAARRAARTRAPG